MDAKYGSIPVEHIMTERIKQNKSLVDIKLTARACQEHYQNHVDSFVIVSSDSDYQFLHGRKSVVDLLHFRHFHGAHHKDFHFFCADMGSSFFKRKAAATDSSAVAANGDSYSFLDASVRVFSRAFSNAR